MEVVACGAVLAHHQPARQTRPDHVGANAACRRGELRHHHVQVAVALPSVGRSDIARWIRTACRVRRRSRPTASNTTGTAETGRGPGVHRLIRGKALDHGSKAQVWALEALGPMNSRTPDSNFAIARCAVVH